MLAAVSEQPFANNCEHKWRHKEERWSLCHDQQGLHVNHYQQLPDRDIVKGKLDCSRDHSLQPSQQLAQQCQLDSFPEIVTLVQTAARTDEAAAKWLGSLLAVLKHLQLLCGYKDKDEGSRNPES